MILSDWPPLATFAGCAIRQILVRKCSYLYEVSLRNPRTFSGARSRRLRAQPLGVKPGSRVLDANETTWAFSTLVCVGCDGKPHVTELKRLGSYACRRNYCGLTADQRTGG